MLESIYFAVNGVQVSFKLWLLITCKQYVVSRVTAPVTVYEGVELMISQFLST